MQTLRIYRPRVIIHGPLGMGQAYIGAAALHHLEGYHVQSLELGTLMSDSTRVCYNMRSFLKSFIADAWSVDRPLKLLSSNSSLKPNGISLLLYIFLR